MRMAIEVWLRGPPDALAMTANEFSSAEAYQRLGAIISQVQSRFIRAAPAREVFEPLLTDLLGFTGSEYGFIADVVHDPQDGHRFLRLRVLTDISWDDTTRAIFADHVSGRQPVEFHNLKTLFGAAVTTGEIVIANDPLHDPRSSGRPSGHPPLLSFLGVPLNHGGEMVGMVGLANRPGGYDRELVAFLDPLFASVGAIIGAVRMEAARIEAERAVGESQVALLAAATAQRANAAKTEFLSRMSHELRTPLNAVLGFSQLLRMDAVNPLTPKQSEWARHIENAGTHLLAMINDVLDLSRIESGSMPLSIDTVVLELAVREALALVGRLASEGEVQIRVEPHRPDQPRLSQVRADHLRLRQVLVNLLGNAIKYNRRGGTVVVAWRPSAAHAARIELEVRDTGLGMSTEQLAHLFEPFNRLGAETGSIEGTGIGLVISQRLVQTMGGELEVSSEKGVGSCFRISLPAAPAEAMHAIAAETGSPATALDAAAGVHTVHTVLYADDNTLNIELVLAVLSTRPDLRALVARNGREAIEIARREPPDLMLLDMHLGDISGLEVMQTLARDRALAHIPCLALSADAMPAAIERAERAGFKAYLTKPLNVKKLLHCIDKILAERSRRACDAGLSGFRRPVVPGRRADRFAPQVDRDPRSRMRAQGSCAAHIGERHAGVCLRAPADRRQFADGCAGDRQRFATPRVMRRRVEHDRHELLAQRLAPGLQQRGLADEIGRLVELDGIGQAGLERRLVGAQLGAPGAAPGLDAQRVERVVAGVDQAASAA